MISIRPGDRVYINEGCEWFDANVVGSFPDGSLIVKDLSEGGKEKHVTPWSWKIELTATDTWY